MTSFLYGIICFIMLGFVQYSWFYESTNGLTIEFRSTKSYVVTSIVLGILVGYLVTSGITHIYS